MHDDGMFEYWTLPNNNNVLAGTRCIKDDSSCIGVIKHNIYDEGEKRAVRQQRIPIYLVQMLCTYLRCCYFIWSRYTPMVASSGGEVVVLFSKLLQRYWSYQSSVHSLQDEEIVSTHEKLICACVDTDDQMKEYQEQFATLPSSKQDYTATLFVRAV